MIQGRRRPADVLGVIARHVTAGRSPSGGRAPTVAAVVLRAGVWAGVWVALACAGLAPAFLGPPVVGVAPGAAVLAGAPASDADGDFAFLLTAADGTPVRWDRCVAIHLVVRDGPAPPDASDLVASALAAVAAGSGLSFVVDGTTDEAPAVDRAARLPDRYGPGRPPVLVAWSDEDEYAGLGGDRAGVTAPVAVTRDGSTRYVTGTVVLDQEWFRAQGGSPEGRQRQVAVLEHELGHLVGLDHVPADDALMNPVYRGRYGFAPGDLAGLAVAGEGPCSRAGADLGEA